ncbi:hypothetical protein DERF_011749 [Dermatophagoides farinae]|uniref:Amino acid transporter n=1 Tax=Dermatophagoides farinae TaxID=6954 RepID=A0A922HTL4_DERFA|nr:excitatory amino acid transporter 3-like [Dermatophagoides farinae]KAH7643282.1 sodium:dicarboxylate symporter-like protein 1 [Dermatophagoides farinae]KAH9507045.1 hypothetical protein DERF_011749 [Dermatophagoides farinae]
MTRQTRQEKIRTLVKENLLPLCTCFGVIAAIIIGIIVRASSTHRWTERQLMYLEFPGELFLRALKCLTIPLIVSSLVSALGSLDSKISGKIGKRALIYYGGTTAIAISLGIFLVLTLHPGSGKVEQATIGEAPTISRKITTPDTVLDLIRNLIPDNVVQTTFSQYATNLVAPKSMPNETDLSKWNIKSSHSNGINVLGLVTLSVVSGIFVGKLARLGRPLLLDIFNDLSEMTLQVTNQVIKATPIGVAFLILPRIIAVEDAGQLFRSVGFFTFTVILGILVHGLLILPGIYYLIVRKNPYRFVLNQGEALLTAFGTASSTATLPSSIACLEEKNKINRNVVRFVAPIGATINMDGTALYEAVAAIFIAQSREVDMDFARVLIVSITATAASVGAAGIPQAGLITMVIVLNALGLPPEDISLVFIIDWLVDRIRTPINVLGDAFGSAIVEHLSRDDLHTLEQQQQQQNQHQHQQQMNTATTKTNGANQHTLPTLVIQKPSPTNDYSNQAFDAEFDEKL